MDQIEVEIIVRACAGAGKTTTARIIEQTLKAGGAEVTVVDMEDDSPFDPSQRLVALAKRGVKFKIRTEQLCRAPHHSSPTA